ncbi:MAG: DUF4124 domain-containing protein [Pseudomonas sp.]|uniref:DUF4124 domain-containing protein n=1 Tax=Pseudomonas sp. TaxID=306 RepID=UPI003BB657BD
MQGLLRAAFCASLLYSSNPTLAASVYRCEDDSGHITFTLQGCATNQKLQVQNADNPRPGDGKPVLLAKSKKHPRRSKAQKNQGQQLVVVGEHQDGCGNKLTGASRRTAMIGQQVRSGMTLKDIESALGKPDKISNQNGQMRYLYRDKEGNSKQVSFDENGCVRSKR